ncbi:penicillin-binding protein 1C [Variovorax sp. VNK109]|uniref:penicillin-binding protein 1C n=1 Tax=Variovorax sp. VNK109 TaxID=3400919 RepID=UPI003C018A86
MRLAALTLAGASAVPPAQALPSYSDVRQQYQPSDTLILDRDGELLHRIRTDTSVRRGQWIALADTSPALRTALVLGEDRRFHEHSGVDWRAVSAAAWGNLWNTRTRGASTITMQLAGLLDEDLAHTPGGRSVTRKLGQAVAATRLEASWRKDQILEAYLNLVPFRGELVGIDALSRTLFGKAAHGLDEREAAIAAALVRAPNSSAKLVAQRACELLGRMQPGTRVDCVGLDMFATAAMQQRSYAASEGIAAHVAARLVREQRDSTASSLVASTRITTTLRAPLQRFATETLSRQLRELAGRHVEDGAIIVLDNRSGDVLAWVGSSGPLSRAGEVDGVTALRQAGSTLKPFLYAQAIAEKRLTAASLLEDSPTHIPTSGGLYIPQNYDRQFKGWVSVRTALGASLNVPAVRTLGMVSPDAFHRQLKDAGLPLRETGGYYGFSLALGSPEVSLLSLSNAYRVLANGGRYGETQLLPVRKPAASRQVFDERAAFIVGDILSDTNARARTFGTGSVLATRSWTAVKTGTSKDMRDNWAVGWSQRYTVGVWVGNASGEPMWDVSGSTGAAPIWAAVMGFLHAQEPGRAPRAPAGLEHAVVKFASQGTPLEAARMEWFLPGTMQPVFAVNSLDDGPAAGAATAAVRITAPADGTIVALDPDIPPDRQRLDFTAHGQGTRATGLRWRMDGREFARGPSVQWLPWPGRHAVQLVNAGGDVLDEIRIEVRGAGVKAASARTTSLPTAKR